MDDMINRHDSIAEENIEPNGRPAKNRQQTSLRNGVTKFLTVQIMFLRKTRKRVLLRIVKSESKKWMK